MKSKLQVAVVSDSNSSEEFTKEEKLSEKTMQSPSFSPNMNPFAGLKHSNRNAQQIASPGIENQKPSPRTPNVRS